MPRATETNLEPPPMVVQHPDGYQRPSPDDEWLLTTGNGGFAMGTASGMNRRRYHALLIASARPPVDRVSCLASVDETLFVGGEAIELSTHRFRSGTVHPPGAERLERFEKLPTMARWVYRAQGVEVIKELRLAWRRNACAVRYIVRTSGQTVRLRLEPRITLRDFHALNTDPSAARYELSVRDGGMRVVAEGRALRMRCAGCEATPRPDLFRDVYYDFEAERQQDSIEHQFMPGWFEREVTGEATIEFVAAMEPDDPDDSLSTNDARAKHLRSLRGAVGKPDAALGALIDASVDFLVKRTVNGHELTTVIAGYPWFADWGRDSMVSLPGLMLVTRRFEEARGTLVAFARSAREGLIPNLFDDRGGEAQYNTVDASLWFLHACHAYLRASGDRAGFEAMLLPACHEIIARYRSGTRFGIGMDPDDGLIVSGDESTQLTWMDAKRDGVVFTPRHGKPVEVNALWHHGLLCIAEAIGERDPARATAYRALADRVAGSFRAAFWSEEQQRLHDCLQRDDQGRWRPVPQRRPNQIFAASLEFSPLALEQRRAVVRDVRARLLTPMGLRTLAPDDPGYRARFEGDMWSRDAAYHNGTVWPWLIGPFCEALLRLDGFSAAAKAEVHTLLAPLIESIRHGCLGQIAEVYDAEEPRRPQGCMAQAWSVAEVLRLSAMCA